MVDPGTAAVVLGVLLMVSPGVSTGTLMEQAAAGPDTGQLLPGVAVVIVLASAWLPVSGLLTVTVPVTVTAPPTGMSPVHTTAVPLITIVPEVAVWSPLGTASSNTFAALVLIVMSLYGVLPVLTNVAVNRTTLPGVVDATPAVFVITNCDTVTAEEHRGSVPPDGQLLPIEADVTVLVRISLSVSGLLTVTEKVMVAVPLAGTVPVQLRSGLVNETVPVLAAASLL